MWRSYAHTGPSGVNLITGWSRKELGGWLENLRKRMLDRPPLLILVVVANIQVRALKTEVEKGFMPTLFGHDQYVPKVQGKPV